MATVTEGYIQVGGNRTVGRIWIDPGTIRSGGGPYEPRLVIPVSVEMHSQPANKMICLVRLRAVLYDGATNVPNTKVGPPVVVDLIEGMRCRSFPEGTRREVIDLEFMLTPAAVARLEAARHRTSPGSPFLFIAFQGTIAWASQTHGEVPPRGGDDNPFQSTLGLHSNFSMFWTTNIDTLNLGIDPTVWVAQVLPGLGVNRVRLVEIPLPPETPSANAAAGWDEANAAFHTQKYDDCVAHCRTLIRAWNNELGASKQLHLATVVGDRSGWLVDDPRRALLDAVWQGILDVANAPHHTEANGINFKASAADAEFHLLMTAVVSDYVAKLTGRSLR